MIYALVAAGFVVIYKASDVINFAQGDLLLLGTYLIFFAVAQTGLPWSLGVLVTLLLAVAVALAVERLVLRPLVGEPIISMIMVTIGLSSVLRGVINAIWGPNPRSFDSFLPAGDIAIGPAVLSTGRVLSIPIALAVLAGLGLFFRYTRDGIAHARHRRRPAGGAQHGDQHPTRLRSCLGAGGRFPPRSAGSCSATSWE